MHHHSTKQRLAALRRKLGIHLTPPKWAQERSRKFKEAAEALKAARAEAARQIVAALTPPPRVELTPAPILATSGSTADSGDAPTAVARAPYPSQHLSATDAARSRPEHGGGGGDAGGEEGPGGSKRWIWIALLVLLGLAIVAGYALSKKEPVAKAPPLAPVEAVAPTPSPPPPPPPPTPGAAAPKQLTVAKGDCLWNLSASHLGGAQAWRRLFEANRGKIRNPDLIYPGQVLELP